LAAWFHPAPVDPASEMVVAWEPGRHLAIRTPAAGDGSMHAFEYLVIAELDVAGKTQNQLRGNPL
jgi:hypothetical protein